MNSPAHWKAKSHRAEYDVMRERLLNAAWDYACEKGVRRLTLNAVATQADCARSSVYRYFDNKEQLLGALLQERIYRFGQEMEGELQRFEDPREQLVRGLFIAVTAFRTSPAMELFRTLLGDGEQHLPDILLNYIPRIAPDILSIGPFYTQARADGLLREDVSDEEVLRWMVTIGLALAQQSASTDDADAELAYLRKMLLPSIFKPGT